MILFNQKYSHELFTARYFYVIVNLRIKKIDVNRGKRCEKKENKF